MLNFLVPYVLALRQGYPRLFDFLVGIGRRYFGKTLGIFPRPLAHEVRAVTAVIRGSQWNMVYGRGLVHERLEREFSDYLGGGHAVAVNTGGMALQMALRGLGLKPGDEVIHQIDTCSATAMAVMNAGCTPCFADVSAQTFMLSMDSVQEAISPRTRAIIATHMWGNPERMGDLLKFKSQDGMVLIEDACLALGARYGGNITGCLGDVGVFSFGCLKPIQGGEGGMIFTRNESLARELRAMRHWGDRTIEYGDRDTLQLSWNGRMSEIVAAVVREQLKGYPRHLERLREAVEEFARVVRNIDGLDLVIGAAEKVGDASYTQVVLRLDEERVGWTKNALMAELYQRGIQVRHANFELINSLTFFRSGSWKQWLPLADKTNTDRNYLRSYPTAETIFAHSGIGLGQLNFLSRGNLRNVIRQVSKLAANPA